MKGGSVSSALMLSFADPMKAKLVDSIPNRALSQITRHQYFIPSQAGPTSCRGSGRIKTLGAQRSLSIINR
jgi:hypothetical protein